MVEMRGEEEEGRGGEVLIRLCVCVARGDCGGDEGRGGY